MLCMICSDCVGMRYLWEGVVELHGVPIPPLEEHQLTPRPQPPPPRRQLHHACYSGAGMVHLRPEEIGFIKGILYASLHVAHLSSSYDN